MPIHDWQFYVVTIAALCGLWALLAPLTSARRNSGRCRCCDPAPARTRRTPLTLNGRKT